MVLVLCSLAASAQVIADARKRGLPNLPAFEYKKVHFGFLVGFNFLDFHIYNTGARTDENGHTARYGEIVDLSPGLNLGIVTDFRLCQNLNLRVLPGISFGERNISFINEYGELIDEPAKIKSTFVDVPVLLKYSAFRMNNVKPYVVGGTSVRYDLAKDKQSHMALKSFDTYCDLGAGLDFYLSYFRFSVELRGSFGLFNVYSNEPSEDLSDIPYRQAIDGLKSRMIGLTFYFE